MTIKRNFLAIIAMVAVIALGFNSCSDGGDGFGGLPEIGDSRDLGQAGGGGTTSPNTGSVPDKGTPDEGTPCTCGDCECEDEDACDCDCCNGDDDPVGSEGAEGTEPVVPEEPVVPPTPPVEPPAPPVVPPTPPVEPPAPPVVTTCPDCNNDPCTCCDCGPTCNCGGNGGTNGDCDCCGKPHKHIRGNDGNCRCGDHQHNYNYNNGKCSCGNCRHGKTCTCEDKNNDGKCDCCGGVVSVVVTDKEPPVVDKDNDDLTNMDDVEDALNKGKEIVFKGGEGQDAISWNMGNANRTFYLPSGEAVFKVTSLNASGHVKGLKIDIYIPNVKVQIELKGSQQNNDPIVGKTGTFKVESGAPFSFVISKAQ